MPPTQPKLGPALTITLDNDRKLFAPGDTITGYVSREAHVVSAATGVAISLFGRTESKQADTGNRLPNGNYVQNKLREYFGRFKLIDERETAQMIFEGPLHIPPDGEPQRWPFTMTIPTFVDPDVLAPGVPQEESFLALDAHSVAGHGLPSTFYDHTRRFDVLVEYYLQADIHYHNQGVNKVENAVLPLCVRNIYPEHPIVDFQPRGIRHNNSVVTQRLVPGMEEAKLTFSQKTQKLFHAPSVPAFHFQLQVEAPSVVQLDNASPIPLPVRIIPDRVQTSDIIKDVPQKVKLTSISVQIKAITHVVSGGEYGKNTGDFSKETDLISRTVQRQDIEIPCSEKVPALDVGEIVGLRIRSRFGDKELYPSFTTYNIRHSHKLKWEIEGTVAGESFKSSSESDMRVLPPSVDPAPIYSPAEDDMTSWIHPPDEDEPPSFAQAQTEQANRGESSRDQGEGEKSGLKED